MPMPKFGGIDAAFSPDCCQAPCLRLPMYCGRRRIAAMISAQVSSAGATGEPTPFGDGDAQPGAGLDVDVRADPAGLRDQLELRQLLEQLAREVGALADQHQHLGVAQAHRELADALDGVGEDLGVEVLQERGALELAHGVLVVVEDDDVHGSGEFDRGAARLESQAVAHCARAPARGYDPALHPLQETR